MTQKNRGMTVLELLIAVAIMAVLTGVIGMISSRGVALMRTSSANNEIESRAARALDRVVREMLSVSSSSLAPDLVTPPMTPTVWSENLAFQDAIDWQAGALILGPARRITLQYAQGELDNGIDDNGDGLIDEGSVVLIDNEGQPDQVTRVLVSGVSELLAGETANGLDDNGNGLVDERGFCFDLSNDVLNVSLSLQRLGPDGNLIVRTHRDSLRLHN